MLLNKVVGLRACALVLAAVTACSRPVTPPALPPAPLDDSGSAAVRWVDQHAVPLSPTDSGPVTVDRAALRALVGDARVLGISELAEGTREFPRLVRTIVTVLAEDAGLRGLAIQAPGMEALEIDRYVRGGPGDAARLLRMLGAVHWQTRDMAEFVEWLRQFNRGRAPAEQVGFYGFEIPNALHAIQVMNALADSTLGPALKQWFTREYACVTEGERANWGREGFSSDSTYWKRCAVVANAAVDSLAALRQRTTGTRAADVAFAELTARLVAHYVTVGLRHLPRHQTVAEHEAFLLSLVGTGDAKMLLWGRDVEAGRLQLEGGGGQAPVIQSVVPLNEMLKGRYRSLAFAFGDGTIRASRVVPGREPGDETIVAVPRPSARTYENVLIRASLASYLLDMRSLPTDMAGAWLAGPHPMRMISGVYAEQAPDAFLTPLKFPSNYDGIVFVKRVRAAVAK